MRVKVQLHDLLDPIRPVFNRGLSRQTLIDKSAVGRQTAIRQSFQQGHAAESQLLNSVSNCGELIGGGLCQLRETNRSRFTGPCFVQLPVEVLPGWETRLYMIDYSPAADGSGHHHPVPGLGYMLSGTILSAFADEEVVSIKEGQGFVDRHTWFTRCRGMQVQLSQSDS